MAALDGETNQIDKKRDAILGPKGEKQLGLVATETKIKYKDVFHLKNLYRYMHEWLINDGWGTHSDPNWPETLYYTNQRADGEEIWWWWRMNKIGDNKQITFFKKFMDVDCHVLYLVNKEIVLNGHKVKANFGEVEIIIRARMAVDPTYEWRNHWLLKHILEFYWRTFNLQRSDQQKQELYQDAYKFHAALKNFFKMYQVEPDRAPFRSHGGMETPG
jgi:hypothetical protein